MKCNRFETATPTIVDSITVILATLETELDRSHSRPQIEQWIITLKNSEKLAVLLPNYELIHVMYGAGYCYEVRLEQDVL